MPRRTNEFQSLIAIIEKVIAQQGAVVTESKELIDRITNRKREVDIVIEADDSDRGLILCIECTGSDKSRPATVEWVERMWGKHAHLPTTKLMLVSKNGFTSAARLKAEKLGIDVQRLEEAEVLDWKSIFRNMGNLSIEVFAVPYATEVKLLVPASEISTGIDLSSLEVSALTVWRQNDSPASTIGEIVATCLNDKDLLKQASELATVNADTTLLYNIPQAEGSYIIDGKGVKRKVSTIQVVAKCRKELPQFALRPGFYGQTAVARSAAGTMSGQMHLTIVQRSADQAPVAYLEFSEKSKK